MRQLQLPIIIIAICCLFGNACLATTFPGLSFERPSLFWGNSQRSDGSTRFWDPAAVIDVHSNLVCVVYGALDENGNALSIGPLPPKRLAKTLVNAKPELQECHNRGIRVIGYQDTIQFMPSTFRSEGIDPASLYALDINGQPVKCDTWTAGNYMSCINNPNWLTLQKQGALVTAEAGFDSLQFDLYPYAVLPGYHCHCQYCQSAWKSYSQKKFGVAKTMPGTTLSKSDPVHRAYIEWRMLCMADFLKVIEDYVQQSYPQFVILQNNCVDGLDYPCLALNSGIKYPSTELWHITLGDESFTS